MKASSQPTVGPVSLPESQEFNTYNYSTNFNLFIFSRNVDGTPLFLLQNSTGASAFTHFAGAVTEHDPIVAFAMARDFVTKTQGLLTDENISQFLADNTSPVDANELVLESLNVPIRPQKGFTPAVDDICLKISETPFRYQNTSGSATIFVELPMLNLEAFNQAARQCEIDIQAKYFTIFEILDENNEEVSQESRDCFDESALYEYVENFIVNCQPIEITGRFALISCDSTANTSMLRTLHYSINRKHGEAWKYYRAYENELPTDQELQKLNGVLVSGSPHSAYETNTHWFDGLFSLQRKIANEYKHVKYVGICFGAQSMAQALGGRVEKMSGPYIRGGDTLQFESSFFEFQTVRESGVDRSMQLVIAESHGDHIAELPPGAVLQASSTSTNVEIYTIGKNVLALQGHPEYNEIWTAGANYRINKLSVEDYDVYAQEYIRAKFQRAVCQKELQGLCFRHLKN